MLNMNDIGYFLYMEEQENKRHNKFNVEKNSSLGAGEMHHNTELDIEGEKSQNRSGE